MCSVPNYRQAGGGVIFGRGEEVLFQEATFRSEDLTFLGFLVFFSAYVG